MWIRSPWVVVLVGVVWSEEQDKRLEDGRVVEEDEVVIVVVLMGVMIEVKQSGTRT